MSEEEKKNQKDTRNERGQFVEGNTIGKDTRFQEDNDVSSKYKDEYCELLLDYFMQPSTRTEYKETYFKGEVTSRTPIRVMNDYPTFELFAASIGVTCVTLFNWCKSHPRFKFFYSRAKEIQRGKLTSNAVIGLYNPVYAKFEAVNNHDLKDKQEVDTNLTGIGLDDRTLALIERVERRLNGEGDR